MSELIAIHNNQSGGEMENILTEADGKAFTFSSLHEQAVCYSIDFYNLSLGVEEGATSTLGVNCGMSTGRNGVLIAHTKHLSATQDGTGNKMVSSYKQAFAADCRNLTISDSVTCTIQSNAEHSLNGIPVICYSITSYDASQTDISPTLDTASHKPFSNQ